MQRTAAVSAADVHASRVHGAGETPARQPAGRRRSGRQGAALRVVPSPAWPVHGSFSLSFSSSLPLVVTRKRHP